MKLKNLTSYKDFLQIKEAKEFTNDTTWSESLLGKAVGSLLKLFSNGLSNAVFLHSIRNIKGVVLDGVEEYLSGSTTGTMSGTTVNPIGATSPDENNSGELQTPDGTPSGITSDTTESNLQFKFGDENLELKKMEVTNDDGTKSYIDVDKRGQEVLTQLKDSKDIKSIVNNEFFKDSINNLAISEISRKINESIKTYQKNADEFKKIEATNPKEKKALNDLELKNNKLKSLKLQITYDKADLMILKFKFVKLREAVKKLGGYISPVGELFINGQRVDFETLQPIIKPEPTKVVGSEDKKSVGAEFNDVKNGKIIKKKNIVPKNSGNTVESFFYLEDDMINEALLGGFTRYNKKIEELTLQQKNKIDKEAATKKINLSKLYSYHLLSERQYIKGDGTRDAKLENIWKQDVYKALSRFNDLVNVERVNPFSPSFALNKEQKDNISTESKDKIDATNTALGTGNSVAERVKRIGLSETQVPAEHLKGRGINDLYMLNFKWSTRSKTVAENEAMVAVKYMNIGGFDALFLIDTYSKEFMDKYDISKNKIKNTKDINLISFLVGTTFNMESGGTQSIKAASDYTPCFIFKNKLKFPITTLFVTNEVHVFNILKVNDKDEVFIPTLTTKHQEATTSDAIKKAVMNDNLYKKKLNIIAVDIYPVFGIPKESSGEYVTKNKIDINIINNYANEIKAYFQKLNLA
jgi:hypothetical protein